MNSISAASPRVQFQAPAQRASSAHSNVGPADSFVLSQQPPAQEQPPAQQPPAQQPPVNEQPPEQPPASDKKKWTILVYSGADNNLYDLMQTDLDEAEQVGSGDQMNIVVQTDHAPVGGGGQRLKLEKNSEPGLNSPVLQELGPIDMGKPETLADFVKWGVQNFPAENVMLVMSDHGGGWPGAISDDSEGGWLSTPQIREGLAMAREATGKKIDVIGFDACLMASAEVARELKDEAGFLVASQETEGGAGWEYNRVFSERVLSDVDYALRTRLNLTPQELATRVVDAAEGNQGDLPTMSATDLSKAGELTAAVGELSAAVVNSPLSGMAMSEAANASQTFSGFTDLYDFANNLQSTAGQQDANLAAAAQKVKDAVENSVVAYQASEDYPGAHGLHIELSNWGANSGDYAQLKFAEEANWAQAVAKINE